MNIQEGETIGKKLKKLFKAYSEEGIGSIQAFLT